MNKTMTRTLPEPVDESQARRAERGVVAGYIHELSRRHDGDRPAEPRFEPAPEAGEGG